MTPSPDYSLVSGRLLSEPFEYMGLRWALYFKWLWQPPEGDDVKIAHVSAIVRGAQQYQREWSLLRNGRLRVSVRFDYEWPELEAAVIDVMAKHGVPAFVAAP